MYSCVQPHLSRALPRLLSPSTVSSYNSVENAVMSGDVPYSPFHKHNYIMKSLVTKRDKRQGEKIELPP